MADRQTAILGGGCFWCLEAVFQGLKGVSRVTSGYMGGHVAEPSYEQVCSKSTGHAEVVQIEFDPAVIDYGQLLKVFFAIHDPTTLNRQGNDVGPQYRSVIFAMSDAQLAVARDKIASIASHYAAPIVTELVVAFDASGAPLTATEKRFWPAEAEHHNYFKTHPGQGYCAFVVAPKVAKAEREFKDLLA
ncbi:MAG: peptide-methionine (S)-S-oxide reductase MsrA [Burkholderiaceae bacterium]|nr:peptide-methionine (S)-S-oxide reductase MsrA [Burkholderiaceae bacterium]